jgi:hypothetical protein
MNPTFTFVFGIIGSGALTIIGILAVGLRRGPSAGPMATDELSPGDRSGDLTPGGPHRYSNRRSYSVGTRPTECPQREDTVNPEHLGSFGASHG